MGVINQLVPPITEALRKAMNDAIGGSFQALDYPCIPNMLLEPVKPPPPGACVPRTVEKESWTGTPELQKCEPGRNREADDHCKQQIDCWSCRVNALTHATCTGAADDRAKA